jgi:hypothetical protein
MFVDNNWTITIGSTTQYMHFAELTYLEFRKFDIDLAFDS